MQFSCDRRDRYIPAVSAMLRATELKPLVVTEIVLAKVTVAHPAPEHPTAP
jgi:hypothetical protein